jgi:hypothetical protein
MPQEGQEDFFTFEEEDLRRLTRTPEVYTGGNPSPDKLRELVKLLLASVQPGFSIDGTFRVTEKVLLEHSDEDNANLPSLEDEDLAKKDIGVAELHRLLKVELARLEQEVQRLSASLANLEAQDTKGAVATRMKQQLQETHVRELGRCEEEVRRILAAVKALDGEVIGTVAGSSHADRANNNSVLAELRQELMVTTHELESLKTSQSQQQQGAPSFPYDEDSTRRWAREHGYTEGSADRAFAGDYETKGLYAYQKHSGGALAGCAFFGKNGTKEQMDTALADFNRGQFRPHLSKPAVDPMDEYSCKMWSKAMGLIVPLAGSEFEFGGNYATKGLHAYVGSGVVYFGRGGSRTQVDLPPVDASEGQFRPLHAPPDLFSLDTPAVEPDKDMGMAELRRRLHLQREKCEKESWRLVGSLADLEAHISKDLGLIEATAKRQLQDTQRQEVADLDEEIRRLSAAIKALDGQYGSPQKSSPRSPRLSPHTTRDLEHDSQNQHEHGRLWNDKRSRLPHAHSYSNTEFTHDINGRRLRTPEDEAALAIQKVARRRNSVREAKKRTADKRKKEMHTRQLAREQREQEASAVAIQNAVRRRNSTKAAKANKRTTRTELSPPHGGNEGPSLAKEVARVKKLNATLVHQLEDVVAQQRVERAQKEFEYLQFQRSMTGALLHVDNQSKQWQDHVASSLDTFAGKLERAQNTARAAVNLTRGGGGARTSRSSNGGAKKWNGVMFGPTISTPGKSARTDDVGGSLDFLNIASEGGTGGSDHEDTAPSPQKVDA